MMPQPVSQPRGGDAFAALKGWSGADHAAAWAALHRSATHIVAAAAELRPARPQENALQRLCRAICARPGDLGNDDARRSFEEGFTPRAVQAPEPGFLTGYYEPVVNGALTRSASFTAPIIDRPANFGPDGSERAVLEAYAESSEARPVVWVADWVEAYLIHVQGSARIHLPDGSERRLVYAGRNGLPYTSIGRRLIESRQIGQAEMSLDRLKGWLRDAGQQPGEAGRRLMQENRSYIFFRLEATSSTAGPIGGQGIPLVAGVSLAVDRSHWSYGLPFFLESDETLPGFAKVPFSGLFIAQDTGSAMVGAARADLFMGSGDAAGKAAGRIRHPARFTVLEPRAP